MKIYSAKNRKILLILLPLSIFLWHSCQSNSKKDKKNKEIDMFEVNLNENEHISSSTNYRIPSPLDLFNLLRQSKKDFLPERLNDAENEIHYNSTLSKSINFGIYSSDLAYCSVFGSFQESLNYFKAMKKMAADLGLYEGFGKNMANRINNNLNNVDSLIEISADSYAESSIFLSSQGLSDIMTTMMVGCWVESIYLTLNSIQNFNKETTLAERIADQQLLLDNLIELINENKKNSSLNLDEILNQLLDLQEEYDRLYENEENVFLTKNQYVEISNKIKVIRNTFIKLD